MKRLQISVQTSESKQSTNVVFDLETGPRPWEEIKCFYTPPEPMAPFDPATVKVGNMGPAKAADKVDAAQVKWQQAKANEGADHEQHRQEFIDKSALSAMRGQVLAIGYKTGANSTIHGDYEPTILEFFWKGYVLYARNGTAFIGHNIFGFDLPFLVQRSWFHGLAVPQEVYADCDRYRSKVFVDTMTKWTLGQRGQFVKLDDLAKFFGIPDKPDDIGGGDFARLWNGTQEEKEQAEDYLRGDLKMTWTIAQRLGLI